jgi:hypothetical protein
MAGLFSNAYKSDAPLRLCGFAIKVICLVADRKVWPAAKTGANGQRPAHGRAGAGLAKMVLTLALTFYPLPQERKSPLHVFIVSADHPANPVACISKDAANDSPSPP